MNLQYRYQANGLAIASDFIFPELQASAVPDIEVSIKRGKVAPQLRDAIHKTPLAQVSADDFLLDIKNTGRFLVKKDNEIIVDACEDADEGAIRLYILSTLFSVILHKRNILTLHASCVNTEGGAVLFAGISGVGKSTLALGLHKKGYEVLSDDLTSICVDSHGDPVVNQGYKHIKLWESSMEQYGYDATQFSKLRNGVNKYSFPLTPSGPDEYPLKRIYILTATRTGNVTFEEMNGLQKFDCIRKNTFRYRLISILGKEQEHFLSCSALINRVPVIKVSRPEQISPGEFAQRITEHWDES